MSIPPDLCSCNLDERLFYFETNKKEVIALRVEIYRQLRMLGFNNLGFNNLEAKEMSQEFSRLLITVGASGAKALKVISKELLVGLIHSWMLAVLI